MMRQALFCRRVVRVVSLLALTGAGWAGAQSESWTPVGPPGGIVTGLAFDAGAANLAYATTAGGGFFRSLDDGTTWKAANAGLSDAHLQGLVTFGGMIFVGGPNGVSLSTTRGRSFALLPGSPILVSALGVGTGAKPPLFAAGVYSGAWRSDDLGQSWQEINEGLEQGLASPAGVIRAFLVDPRRPSLIWAGAANGVYRSLNGGTSWQAANTGLDCQVAALALDTDATLYAGCFVDPQAPAPVPPALFVSHDLGLTWHSAVSGLPALGVTALLADGAGNVWAGTQNAGVYRTTTGGHRWSAAGAGTAGQLIGALAESSHQSALLLAGGGYGVVGGPGQDGPGVFRTTSSGALWTLASAGPDATSISTVVADPVISGLLTAIDTSTGVYRSTSGGASWRLLDGGLPAVGSTNQLQLAGDTAVSGRLYIEETLGDENLLFRHGSVATTSWKPLTNVPATCASPLVAGAQGQLFLGAFDGHGSSVCASSDVGATWTVGALGPIAVFSVAVAPSDPTRVYASGPALGAAPPHDRASAGLSIPTFFRSEDGGVTWTGVSMIASTALAVDPLDADVVYAAAGGGLQRSSDGGATWETLLTGSATSVWVNPHTPSTLFVATPSSGSAIPSPAPSLSVSNDSGATWSPLTGGLPPNVSVTDLAFDATNPSLVYAATAGGGIFTIQYPAP